MIEFEEVTTLEHKSCGMAIVDCLAYSDIVGWKAAFNSLIDKAVELGLMPDCQEVLNETLKQHSFIMQSAALENMPIRLILRRLTEIAFIGIVFIQISAHMHLGGYMLAFRVYGNGKSELLSELPEFDPYCDSDCMNQYSTHVWLRWDDNEISETPFPRKPRENTGRTSYTGSMPEETDWYKPFQPNPHQNFIGDCVVRAAAGSLNITWEEAVRLLASSAKTTVNAGEVFQVILARQGFVHCDPIIRGGRHLDGKAFCAAMNWQYQNGERIFAYVGRSHVAAVIPVRCDDGMKRYKIADCWDSTGQTIGEYWVLPAELLPKKKNAPIHPVGPGVGSRIIHKSFGNGEVVSADGNMLSIDFEKNGVRRLEKTWVEKNCYSG